MFQMPVDTLQIMENAIYDLGRPSESKNLKITLKIHFLPRKKSKVENSVSFFPLDFGRPKAS